jgi:hypothetical protein
MFDATHLLFSKNNKRFIAIIFQGVKNDLKLVLMFNLLLRFKTEKNTFSIKFLIASPFPGKGTPTHSLLSRKQTGDPFGGNASSVGTTGDSFKETYLYTPYGLSDTRNGGPNNNKVKNKIKH